MCYVEINEEFECAKIGGGRCSFSLYEFMKPNFILTLLREINK